MGWNTSAGTRIKKYRQIFFVPGDPVFQHILYVFSHNSSLPKNQNRPCIDLCKSWMTVFGMGTDFSFLSGNNRLCFYFTRTHRECQCRIPVFVDNRGRALYDSHIMNRVHSYKRDIYTIHSLSKQHADSHFPFAYPAGKGKALYFCALPTDLKWIFIQYLFTNEGGFL